jgi:hypothetical protein
MAYTMPEDMPQPQTLTNENDGLRALLYAAAGIIQADDLACCRMVIQELRKGLEMRTFPHESNSALYRGNAITRLVEAETWLLMASWEE